MQDIIQRSQSADFMRKLLRVSIVVGVILFAMLLVTWRHDQSILMIVTAVPLTLVAARLLWQYPPLGFIALILVANLVNFEINPVGLMVILVFALAVLWLSDMFVVKKEIRLIPSPTYTPLLMFSAVVVLAFILGQLPWFSVSQVDITAQLAGGAIFIVSFLLFILVSQQVKDIKWLKWMVYLFLLTGTPAVILALIPDVSARQLLRTIYHPRTVGGSLFWVWFTVMGISQALFNKNLPRRWRILFFVIAAAYVYLGLFMRRSWTSGWAPVVVALVALIWIARPKWAMPATMIGGAVAIAMFPQIYNAVMIGDNEYSALTRLAAWEIVWEIVKVNPVFGLGPGNYYNYTTLFPILGWYVEFNSHNNYVDIIAQTGFLGIICYFWFFFLVARIGWRLRNRVPAGGFAQAYVYGAMAGLVGTVFAGMLGDWVLPFVYNIGIFGLRASLYAWMFMGGLIAIDRMVKNEQPLP